MRSAQELISMALILVGIFLVVNNWKGSTEVIKAIGSFFSTNFETLQARWSKWGLK